MRRPIVAVAALALVLGGGGCATLRDLPLPGLVSGETYPVTAVFESALGLPEQAPVKLDGAVVGEVTTIETVDYTARVGLVLAHDVAMPADIRAEVRFGSPMGEAFVELLPPEGGGRGRLAEGGTIPLEATSEAPSVGDLLTAVSALVTGGSFADMRIVITELNVALRGNQGNIRRLLGRLDGMVTRLDDHTREFDVALASMDRLGADLARDGALLGRALRELEPAVRTLSGQREELLRLMGELRRLSRTATATLRASRTDMLSVIRDLGPVLDTLTRNEARFRPILDGIGSFGARTDGATYGLFLNFDLTTVVDGAALAAGLRAPQPAPGRDR